MKILITLLLLAATSVFAANPSFQQFNTNHFAVVDKVSVSLATTNASVYINAGAMIPSPTDTPAAATTQTGSGILYDSFDFDSSATEEVGFWWTFPTNYVAGENIKASFHWTAVSGTGSVAWQVWARAYSAEDSMEQTPGSYTSSTNAFSGADELQIDPAIEIPVDGTPAPMKPVFFLLSRDVSISGDLAADAKLLGVEITYPIH